MINNSENLTLLLNSDYEQDLVDLNTKYNLYIIAPIIGFLIIFFGIIGNGLIIYIILKRRLYKNSCTNCYIINVAISDLCFSWACVPVTMTAYVYKEWIFGNFMCHFQNLLMFSSIQATCLTLTAMTVDRYLAVLFPFKSIEYRTTKIALLTNIIIWIASFILNTPYYLYYEQQIYNSSNETTLEMTYCVSTFPTINIEIGLTLYTVLISYVLPLLTIIFCYMRMIIKIYSKSSDQTLLEQSKCFSNTKSTNINTKNSDLLSKKHEETIKNSEEICKLNRIKKTSNTEPLLIENNNKSNGKKTNKKLFKRSLSISSNHNYNYTSKLSNSSNINNNNNHSLPSAIQIKKQKFKILLLIATVSITFALTWLPAHVIQIWKVAFNSSFPYNDAMYIIKFISHILTYSNSLLNPFIYVFIGAKFRSHIYSEFNNLYQYYFSKNKKTNNKSKLSNSSYVAIFNNNNNINNMNKNSNNLINKKDVSFISSISNNHCYNQISNKQLITTGM